MYRDLTFIRFKQVQLNFNLPIDILYWIKEQIEQRNLKNNLSFSCLKLIYSMDLNFKIDSNYSSLNLELSTSTKVNVKLVWICV